MIPQGEPATVILASTSDIASRTLAEAMESEGFQTTGVSLLGNPVYQKGSLLLARFEEMVVTPPNLDEYFNPQAYIFLSRHSAESGIPSLTAHTTGNFGQEAEIGGNPRELGRTDPSLLKNYLRALWARRDAASGYQVTLEATHHGPTSLQKPVLFVELGSSEKYWGDANAARVVAGALIESLTEKRIWPKVAIGFGGTHYSEKFTKMTTEGEFALSFFVPKYALGEIDDKMVGQMVQKCNAPTGFALLDWKGLGAHKEKVVGLVKQFGLEEVRV